MHAETRDRTGDLQIFSLTLSQLSYRGFGVDPPVCAQVWEVNGVPRPHPLLAEPPRPKNDHAEQTQRAQWGIPLDRRCPPSADLPCPWSRCRRGCPGPSGLAASLVEGRGPDPGRVAVCISKSDPSRTVEMEH